MRFPIYTFDLTPKRRFKRIANVLRHHWPIANDISLMTAQEILARGLGYRDFHDVSQSSKNCSPDAPVPTLPEVRDNVSTSIFQFLKSSNVVGIDDSDIERLVMLLPLHELLAFHSLRQGQTADVGKTHNHGSKVRSRQKSTEAARGVIHEASDSSGTVPSSSASLVLSKKLLSEHELDAIAEVVHRKAIIRDRVLFSVLLSGIRQSELHQLRVENVIHTHDKVMLDLPFTKSRTIWKRRILITTDGLLVRRYIEKSALSHGDYLFPSGKTSAYPMTSFELNRILRSWLLEAQIDPTGMSVHALRLSVIARFIRAIAESKQSTVANLTGHISPEMLRYYGSLLNLKPKA
ncbi:tyrosine-type recombinase/integrase [Pseudomonas nunensis]|uniref:Site-specific integrase n=1 Tax=Pseudomonas nunensis TaxID=2961896 RepID=A0ABY5EN06_9PSED|nr:tyrosine-type recombinase/integrase [Pseudomonas nunensis]MCL5230669.1 site-specific integrase [Pseudomonas nunensis]UTO15682.1 site-specific integrase [Pseudomonas nunensis]